MEADQPMIPTVLSNYLETRAPVGVRWLFWVEATNRTTLLSETLGIWTGNESSFITVEGDTRLYVGAPGFIELPVVSYSPGTDIRQLQLRLPGATPEIREAVLGYNLAMAPIQVHQMFLDENGSVISIVRRFKGFIDKAPLRIPAASGVSALELSLVSSFRMGTRTLALKKSDESQKSRHATDRFRKYGSVAGAVGAWWGEKRST